MDSIEHQMKCWPALIRFVFKSWDDEHCSKTAKSQHWDDIWTYVNNVLIYKTQ